MASNVGDKILWTTVIVSGIAAYWYIPYLLYQVKEAAAVAIPQRKPIKPHLEKDAEAAIKTSTLADLADGPSYNLTASAIRLTASKFLKSNVKHILLKDLGSSEHDHRDKAVNALNLLLTNPALKENSIRSHFTDEISFNSLVTALVSLLPEHEKAARSSLPPPSPVRPTNRSSHELAILSFVVLLINEPRKIGTDARNFYIVDAQLAIDAGIITRWLKHYPFPCTLSENRRWNFKRHDVVRLLRIGEWGGDDEQMSCIVSMLMKLPDGARQLADIGLRSSSVHNRINVDSSTSSQRRRLARHHNISVPGAYSLSDELIAGLDHPDIDDDDDDLEEGTLLNNEEMLSRLQDPSTSTTTSRHRNARTAGERSLRRRHRQAIVVAEAGVPLSQSNILQRQPTETELTWRDQIAMERIDGLEGMGGGVREGPVPPGIELADIDANMGVETGFEVQWHPGQDDPSDGWEWP